MFAGERVKDRNVVPIGLRRLACLDEADLIARLGEADRDRAASRTGPDDDVVEVGILWSSDSFLLRRS